MREPPPQYEVVDLPDGGATLRERASGQAMHSSVGPRSEAREVFSSQSDLERGLALSQEEGRPWVLWDMGMGVAANTVATLESIAAASFAGAVEVVSFESDASGLAWVLTQADTPAWNWISPWVEAARLALTPEGFAGGSPQGGYPLRWRLLRGDVRALMRLEPTRPDVIHWDLYSPAHSRALWQPSVWRALAGKLRPAGRLVTYSAATWVRLGMLLAGLCVARGGSTRLKKETTLAALSPDALAPMPLLTREWMRDKLLYSTAPWPDEVADRDAARAALDAHRQWDSGSAP